MVLGIVLAVVGLLKMGAQTGAASEMAFWDNANDLPTYPFTPPVEVSASTQQLAIENALPVVAVVSVAFVAYTYVASRRE